VTSFTPLLLLISVTSGTPERSQLKRKRQQESPPQRPHNDEFLPPSPLRLSPIPIQLQPLECQLTGSSAPPGMFNWSEIDSRTHHTLIAKQRKVNFRQEHLATPSVQAQHADTSPLPTISPQTSHSLASAHPPAFATAVQPRQTSSADAESARKNSGPIASHMQRSTSSAQATSSTRADPSNDAVSGRCIDPDCLIEIPPPSFTVLRRQGFSGCHPPSTSSNRYQQRRFKSSYSRKTL